MSLFSSLSVALSGLQAATTQISLVANNISNATTEGYTTKTAATASVTLGNEGGGVRITGYRRATDTALFNALTDATSDASYRSAQEDYLQQVETILDCTDTSDPALASAMSEFASAWKELSAQPEDSVLQQQVIDAASNLVAQISNASSKIEALDRQITDDINTTITGLNSDLVNIADLNAKISQALMSGQSSSDLEDQRDTLIQEVAAVMNVTVMERANGQIALYTPGGYMLVEGTTARSFTYNGTDVTTTTNTALSLNDVLTGGSLEAMVDFRADGSPAAASTSGTGEVIRKLRDQLDLIVEAFTTSSAGPPETFAYAYANATGTAGEATYIFSGADRFTFEVNAALIDGSETIKTASATAVCETFDVSTRTFSADGLNVSNASYESLVTNILSCFQQAYSNIRSLSETASDQKDFLQESYANKTGVNVDAETVKLTILQNSYAASAHVMAVIQKMFDILEGLV